MTGTADTASSLRRVALGALVAAVLIALAAGTALAHKARYTTATTLQIKDIQNTSNQYSGKVTSVNPKCAHFRLVTLTSSAGLIGRTTTNVNGDYSVLAGKVPQGIDVTATVARKVLTKKKRHKHVCLPSAATRKAPK